MIKTNNIWNYDDVYTESGEGVVFCSSNYFADVKITKGQGNILKTSEGDSLGLTNLFVVESVFVVYLITMIVVKNIITVED